MNNVPHVPLASPLVQHHCQNMPKPCCYFESHLFCRSVRMVLPWSRWSESNAQGFGMKILRPGASLPRTEASHAWLAAQVKLIPNGCDVMLHRRALPGLKERPPKCAGVKGLKDLFKGWEPKPSKKLIGEGQPTLVNWKSVLKYEKFAHSWCWGDMVESSLSLRHFRRLLWVYRGANAAGARTLGCFWFGHQLLLTLT